MKRVILAEGYHWFIRYEPTGLGCAPEQQTIGYTAVCVMKKRNGTTNNKLVSFKNTPQSQLCRLVLEFPPFRKTTKKTR
jgi:hypothetical protein